MIYPRIDALGATKRRTKHAIMDGGYEPLTRPRLRGDTVGVGLSNPIHVVLLIALIAFWVVPAILTGRLAERKGRGFGVYLVASLLLGWLLPLLVALALPDRRAA